MEYCYGTDGYDGKHDYYGNTYQYAGEHISLKKESYSIPAIKQPCYEWYQSLRKTPNTCSDHITFYSTHRDTDILFHAPNEISQARHCLSKAILHSRFIFAFCFHLDIRNRLVGLALHFIERAFYRTACSCFYFAFYLLHNTLCFLFKIIE